MPAELEQFHRRASARGGRGSYCVPCAREQGRETHQRRLQDPVRVAARQAYEEGYRHRYDRERLYGITREEQDALLAAQGGRCAVCRRHPDEIGGKTKSARVLQLDHDHDTGEVRGFLCRPCNSALGLVGDDVDRLIALAAYLLQSKNLLEV